MGEYNDEYYYQKYLKYKNKYLELKQYEGGGMLPETGIYAYFCNKAQADRICEAIYKKTTTSYNINKILSEDKKFIAYKGKHGDTKLTRIRQYYTVKATNATSAAASAAASAAGKSMTSFGTGAMKLGTDFASSVTDKAGKFTDKATAAGKELRTAASNRATAAIKKVTPKQNNLLIGGGDDVVLNLFDKENPSQKKKLDHTDTKYLLQIVRSLRAQGEKYTNINTVVIITYSPMGKNICNNKITFTNDQLMNENLTPVLQARMVIPNMEVEVEADGEEAGGVEAGGVEAGGVEAGGVEAGGPNPNQGNGDNFLGIVNQAVAKQAKIKKNLPLLPNNPFPLGRSATTPLFK
jgi:hypothetical protein